MQSSSGMVVGPTAQSKQSRMAHEAMPSPWLVGQSSTQRASGRAPASLAPHAAAVPSKGYAASAQLRTSVMVDEMTLQVGARAESSPAPASSAGVPPSPATSDGAVEPPQAGRAGAGAP